MISPFQAITNVMGSSFDSWQSTIWMTFLSGTIEMVEEYQVNDLTGIVASLGGSLGLFLGFSCFDCLVMALNAMHNNNKSNNNSSNNSNKDKTHDVEVEVDERELSLTPRNKCYV